MRTNISQREIHGLGLLVCRICRLGYLGGFHEIGGTFLGVPMIIDIVFGGLHWGPPI